MTPAATMPKMIYMPNGFYCTFCDYYFYPELDRSGLPDFPVKWIGHHHDDGHPHPNCPLEGKMFEIDITQVFPEAKKVGRG